MSLSEKQYEVLQGLMLGDGNLQFRGANSSLRINRSIKDIEYAKWIKNIFSEYCTEKSLSTRVVKINNKEYKQVTFYTKVNEDFNKEYRRWYPNGTKNIPRDISLSSTSTAVWFADDGSINERFKNGIKNGFEVCFATNSFPKEQVEYINKILNQKCNAKFKIYGNYKNIPNQYLIKSSTRDAIKLIKFIKNNMPPIERKTKIWEDNRLNVDRWIPCPNCNSDFVFKNGFYKGRGTTKISQKWTCKSCNYRWKAKLTS